MALTNSQLQARIEVIEKWINTLQDSLNNTSTRREMKNLMALISSNIQSLREQIGGVDSTGTVGVPRVTTTERDALFPSKGSLVFNTTSNKLNIYNGSSWEEITSS
jgi:hypothetical protein